MQSHTVLPTISSLINHQQRQPEESSTGLQSQNTSTDPITKANSFPSINIINSLHHPKDIQHNNKPVFLYQPQVAYTQYIPKPVNPPSIPNSRFNSQNILVPPPQIQQQQQPYIQTVQYAIPIQQQQQQQHPQQLAMVNSNGVLTEMTPINFIPSPMGNPIGLQPLGLPHVSSMPQYIYPHPSSSSLQYQAQNNMNLEPPNTIQYTMAPMINNNNNNNSNNATFSIDPERPNIPTYKSPSLPNVAAPTNTTTTTYITSSPRSWSLPMDTNTSATTTTTTTTKNKKSAKKPFGTIETSNCNTNKKPLSGDVTKKSGEPHPRKKSKDKSNIHSVSPFIQHDKIIKSDDKNNKNYTVNFSSAVKHRKQCTICGKICSRPSTLKTHYLIHTGDTPFKCMFEGCNKAFNVKSNMLRHMKCHQRKSENAKIER